MYICTFYYYYIFFACTDTFVSCLCVFGHVGLCKWVYVECSSKCWEG